MLRIWGSGPAAVVRLFTAETVIVTMLALPVGLLLGTTLAWILIRQGGETSLVDPAAPLAVALPSTSTCLLIGGSFLLISSVMSSMTAVGPARASIAKVLRRKGE